jgi:hypothetical protein
MLKGERYLLIFGGWAYDAYDAYDDRGYARSVFLNE